MSAQRRVDIAAPAVGEEEWQALRGPIESGWLSQGERTKEFEDAFAVRHRVAHAVATTSCTAGLHIALTALGIGPGDEVIVPAFTWVATAHAVVHAGAKPVFVDVDRTTFNVDPGLLAERVSERTRAFIPVHLFGLCADMDAIRAALPEHVAIVEDAACAAGAEYHGRPAGSLGDIASFSFHSRKVIVTGEGGMVTTDDPELAALARQLRNNGTTISDIERHLGPTPYLLPEVDMLGFKYRMTDLQAAMGFVQLAKLDRFIDERGKWAAYYGRELADLAWLRLPTGLGNDRHAWQSYVTYVDPETAPLARDEIMGRLAEMGVDTRPGSLAVPQLAYYREQHGIDAEDYAGARDCHDHSMALPLHNRLSEDDCAYVVEALHSL